MENLTFALDGEWIALNDLLKITGVSPSGGMAKAMIGEGQVQVDGLTETRKTCKIRVGQTVAIEGATIVVTEAEAGSSGRLPKPPKPPKAVKIPKATNPADAMTRPRFAPDSALSSDRKFSSARTPKAKKTAAEKLKSASAPASKTKPASKPASKPVSKAGSKTKVASKPKKSAKPRKSK